MIRLRYQPLYMIKKYGLIIILSTAFHWAAAQVTPTPPDDVVIDTFFLAKKSGWLGKLGRSISRKNDPAAKPFKAANPFNKYRGKIIRFIEIVPVGFNQELNDTTEIKRNFAVKLANKFHRNSREITIRKNLFFKEGDVLLPLLISDNERYLRDLPYIRDAAIVVYKSIQSNDSVDIIVLTRDVFSIGGGISISSSDRVRMNVREENFLGTGTKIAFTGLYDRKRNPVGGYGAEFTERNMRGSFLSGTVGYKTFQPAIVSNRYEENTYYARIEKPLINRYTEWTGAVSFSHHQTINGYIEDSAYEYKSQYTYNYVDLWGGYNIGWRRGRQTDSEKRLRHFVSGDIFYKRFEKVPSQFKDNYNYNYANLSGILFSYTLYKQNYFTTSFIYGFGRNEDVPIGLNASLTAGWTNKQGRYRGYYGAGFEASTYSAKGFFSSYTARIGAFRAANAFEDVSLLLAVNHFTRLRQLSPEWYNRFFISLSYTRLSNITLNEPLKLQSQFGLPYFRTDSLNFLEFSSRATCKFESVFFNLHRILGFRFAPFIFAEISFVKPLVNTGNKNDTYSALGAGIRTRNENLVLGTVELRGFYFPKVSTNEMSKWKIVFTANLQFKYNSTFVRKPDFVQVN